MAALPRSCAATLAKDPLKEPTGVRAAETMTTSSMESSFDFVLLRPREKCRECERP
jgi:hypothetical protein